MKRQQATVILLLAVFTCTALCVILNDEEYKILDEIFEEFLKIPTDSRFDHVIQLPISKAHLIPKVFIWCPIMHYNVQVRCPMCNSQLKAKASPKSVNSHKAKPRLIYDIGGNILLIQSIYTCSSREKQHSYMSTTPEILERLPGNTAKKLPFILHYKSGFSSELLDFLLISLQQGHTFQDITEMIASLNYRKFVERNNLAGVVTKSFQDNILYSFVTGDKLLHVFLCDFESKKELYKKCLDSVSCKTLVIDTSCKMEKKFKIKGPEYESFQELQLDNLFLALNENGEVVLWKPIKSKNFEDIFDALLELKQRLVLNGEELNAILTSDCCLNRAAFQQVFPTAPVKMALHHATKFVTDTLPQDHPETVIFAHKLMQIFSGSTTENGRVDETLAPLEIEANLDALITTRRSQLSEQTMNSLDSLRYHIRKGCLSGISPGEGTEKIDGLHRYIQKSILSRVTSITPHMLFAIITCIVYSWNSKKQSKNLFKGKKVVPVMPIEAYSNKSTSLLNTTNQESKIDLKDLPENAGPDPLIIECYLQNNSCSSILVLSNDVVDYMFIKLLHIQDLINAFKDKSHKDLEVSEFPIFSSTSGISPYVKCLSQSNGDDNNLKILEKKLAEYSLELDKVPGDGNCLFRSIVCQALKLCQTSSDFKIYLESIEMGKTQNEDTAKLRELFVMELKSNFSVYKNWLDVSNENFENDLKKFNEDGFFASDIGDLCTKVCANVLQVPIIIIPSLENVKFIPFVPSKFTTASPLYIAYNHSAPGHYDATKDIQVPERGQNKCKCGKSTKYKDGSTAKVFCDPNDTKCPCAKAGLPCVFCLCYNCQNKPAKGTLLTCKCNAGLKRSTSACLNKERTSCCCAKAGLACTERCHCYNCGNGKLEKIEPKDESNGETPRKRKRKSFKFKGVAIKEEAETVVKVEWSDQELICLIVCKEVLASCTVEENVQNISQVYNYIAKSKNNSNLGLSIGIKDQDEIKSKLDLFNISIPEVVTQLVSITTDKATGV